MTLTTSLKYPGPRKNVYLKDHKEQEVGVCEPKELLKQVEREEGEDVVLGSLDGIVLKQRRQR